MACVTEVPIYGFVYSNIPAWDGGARSIISFEGDGYFGWAVSTSVAGAVVGFNTNDTSYHYSDIMHGFKFTRNEFRVIESGTLQTASATFSPTDKFFVFRVGSDVLYIRRTSTDPEFSTFDGRYPGVRLPGPILYISSRPLFGQVFLDASLFEVDDYVYQEEGGDVWLPSISGGTNLVGQEAVIGGALRFVSNGYGSDTLGAFNGTVSGNLGFELSAVGAVRTGVFDGVLPFVFRGGDNLRGWLKGSLPFAGSLSNGAAGSDGFQDGIGGKVRGLLAYNFIGNGGVANASGVTAGELPYEGFAVGRSGGITDPDFDDVVLLMPMDTATGFTDLSNSAHTLTPVGSPTISATNAKFAEAGQFSTGNYLSFGGGVPTDLQLGSTDFKIESWLYLTGTSTQALIGNLNDQNGDGHYWVVLNSTFGGLHAVQFGVEGTTLRFGTGATLPTNTLFHLAVIRKDNEVTTFVDGVQLGTTEALNNFTGTTSVPMYIGMQDRGGSPIAYPLNGVIDDLRVVRNANGFTPANVGDPFWSDVLVLIDAEDAGGTFTNHAPGGSTISNIGTPTKTAVSPISGTQSYQSGSNDALNIDSAPDFGTGEWTIESLVRFDVGAPNLGTMFDAANATLRIERDGNGNLDVYLGSFGSPAITSQGSFTVANEVTFHIAVSKVAGETRAFFNGTQFGSTYTDSNTYNLSGGNAVFGSVNNGSFGGANGKFDLMRVTDNGRYAANFTAPIEGDVLPTGDPAVASYPVPTVPFPTTSQSTPPDDPITAVMNSGELPFAMNAFSAMLSGNYLGIVLPAFTGGTAVLERFEEDISEILAMADALQTLGINEEDIAETFTATESIIALYAFALREEITVTTELRQFIQQAVELLDVAGINDRLTIAMVVRIADVITTADLWTERTAINLAEQLTATDLVETFYQAVEIITSAMTLVDLTRVAYVTAVSSSLTISDDIAIALAIQALINDAMTISDSTENQLYLMAILSDDMNIADSSELTAQYFAEIIESAQIMALLKTPAELAQGWVMNTEGNMPVSEYDNYTFNSLAYGPAGMIGTSDEGIFSLEADDDAGTDIDAEITSMMLDFATSRQKRLSAAWVGYSSTGELVMKVRAVDMNEQVEYCFVGRNVGDAPAPRDNRFKLGKGLRSRYWQFELVNKDGADFEIDQVELYPIRLDRRV